MSNKIWKFRFCMQCGYTYWRFRMVKEYKSKFWTEFFCLKKQIIQYDYKNETVFLIDSCNGCNDNLTIIYNCKGEIICEFGGIAGLNTCPDFEKQANNKRVLWEN